QTRRAHVRVRRDRFFIYANYGFGRIVGLLIGGQRVFHVPDVCPVQLRHAPHFFPATVSTRGCVTKSGLSLDPHRDPVCVCPPLRPPPHRPVRPPLGWIAADHG